MEVLTKLMVLFESELCPMCDKYMTLQRFIDKNGKIFEFYFCGRCDYTSLIYSGVSGSRYPW